MRTEPLITPPPVAPHAYLPAVTPEPAAAKELDIALGKGAYDLLNFAELTGSHSYHTWHEVGLVKLSVGEAHFGAPFYEAATSARSIRFNLEGVNIERALSFESKLAASKNPVLNKPIGGESLITEWELRQVLDNCGLFEEAIFYWGDNVVFLARHQWDWCRNR
ncbi:hypothetical protein VZQ01_36105 [Myxococcus faecalis]|uniref:hypothetical protein n=1 Tax=Myxococcus faecalis TaxID=3115646 RepID=UPI003CFB508B